MFSANQPGKRFLIEACVSTIEDAILASQLGADRLELSAALETDGVTPSLGMLREVLNAVSIPVVTLIRLRSGKFVYQDREVNAMLHDAEQALQAGSQAIAVGCLKIGNQLDVTAMRMFADHLGGAQCVCHRAFDQCADLIASARALCDLGYRRVLTSGGAPSALAGSATLNALQRAVGASMEILVAGGVSPTNLLELGNKTGCVQFHGSFRKRGATELIPRLDSQQLAETIMIRDQG